MTPVRRWVTGARFRFVAWRSGQRLRFVSTRGLLTAASSTAWKHWTNASASMGFDEHVGSIPHRNSLQPGAMRRSVPPTRRSLGWGGRKQRPREVPSEHTASLHPRLSHIYLLIQSRHKEIAFKPNPCQCMCPRRSINHTARYQAKNPEHLEKRLNGHFIATPDLVSAVYRWMFMLRMLFSIRRRRRIPGISAGNVRVRKTLVTSQIMAADHGPGMTFKGDSLRQVVYLLKVQL